MKVAIVIVLCLLLTCQNVFATYIWLGTSPFCQADVRECAILDMIHTHSDGSGDGKACWTGSKVRCQTKTLNEELVQTANNELRLMTYNVFERPFFVTHDGQRERTCHIPRSVLNKFPDLDVIVFEEVFMGGCIDSDSRTNMRALLSYLGFRYTTGTVGSYFIINGGVLIASRWPIESHNLMVYKNSNIGSADYLSKKGAAYAKINKNGVRYNVFGTHMQAHDGDKNENVRVLQAGELRDFVSSQSIPSSEPVIFAGDFNCDLLQRRQHANDVLSNMHSVLTPIVGDMKASLDPSMNDLVEEDNGLEWLDYVVSHKGHRLPKQSSMQAHRLLAHEPVTFCYSAPVQPFYVTPFQSTCAKVKTTSDLSDHYPVIGTFIY